jgi:uncharacterized protein YabN with tetrapyrrole methylase and pyrophosphatase domain
LAETETGDRKRGMLFIVGSGHRIAGQVTIESLNCIRQADQILHSGDSLTEDWIKQINPNYESLDDFYASGKDRDITYNEMVERILFHVRQGLKVCVVFYGHPGICVNPTHRAIQKARSEGFLARMLPGVSALDVLIADLGVDPVDGCQTFEATDFLIRKRCVDTSSALILWQIGVIAVDDYMDTDENWNPEGLRMLVDVLSEIYSPEHVVTVYEASAYPTCDPIIQRVPIAELPTAKISSGSTLYVPPSRPIERDEKSITRLKTVIRSPKR